MATVQNVVNEWASDDEAKRLLTKTHSGLILRWLNEGQLRFADLSEMNRNTWTPTITSSGSIALPTDFLREFPDSVQAVVSTTGTPLFKVDYSFARQTSWNTLTAYSIYDGSFYIWAAGAATPSITYVAKPTALTTLSSDSFEIPTEFHRAFVDYLEAKWLYRNKTVSYGDYKAMLQDFDNQARSAGVYFMQRQDSLMKTRSAGW
jgi:hypothetical protein